VHEYGGGEYHVADGTVVYSEFIDGRLYAVRDDGMPRPITPEGPFRFGDIRVHPDLGLVLAVREDHSNYGEPINTIVALDLDGPNLDGGTVLCGGADFERTAGVDRMESPEHAMGLHHDHDRIVEWALDHRKSSPGRRSQRVSRATALVR
jgi:hypothetical protein